MFIEKIERGTAAFDLHSRDDILAYEELLNDPTVRILERRFSKQTETDIEGNGKDQTVSEKSTMYVYVEYERCNL